VLIEILERVFLLLKHNFGPDLEPDVTVLLVVLIPLKRFNQEIDIRDNISSIR
jgi:hypothetical protein